MYWERRRARVIRADVVLRPMADGWEFRVVFIVEVEGGEIQAWPAEPIRDEQYRAGPWTVSPHRPARSELQMHVSEQRFDFVGDLREAGFDAPYFDDDLPLTIREIPPAS